MMTQEKDIWTGITTTLASRMSEHEFRTWLSGTELVELKPDVAMIAVPNKFVAHWLRENYLPDIRKAFTEYLDQPPKIRFSYGKARPIEKTAENGIGGDGQNLSNYGLDPTYTFSNYVTARSNRFAYSAALRAADDGAREYNPLYIFCKSSFGKSHLLNSIGNHIINKDPLAKVKYLSVERFSKDFSLAKRYGKLTEFRTRHGNLDFLLLDNLDLIGGRKETQRELVNVFNLLYESKSQIVFAAKTPPAGIESLLPELRSRLEWGLLSEISTPERETKIGIIKEKAKQEQLDLHDDILFFLAKATSDLKTLARYIVSIGTHFSLYQREIDLSTVESILKGKTGGSVDVYEIQKLTAGYFNLSLAQLLSDKKKRVFSYPRQVAMYLSRSLTDLSFKEIGKMFGHKDHSTVVYSVARIQKNIKDGKKSVVDDVNSLKAFFS